MTSTRFGTIAYLETILLLLVTAAPLTGQSQKPIKLWSTDLGSDSEFNKRLEVEEVLLTPPDVGILANGKLFCAFYSDGKVGFDLTLQTMRFHVLEIDAQTGAPGRRLDFRSSDDRARALAIGNGGFVALADDALTQFTDDFSAAAIFPAPLAGTSRDRDFWLADPAEHGNEIVLYHRLAAEDRQEVIWLKSNDLTVLKKQPALFGYGPFTATHEKYDVNSLQNSVCSGCIARYLANDVIFLDSPAHFGGARRYLVKTTNGRVLMSGGLEEGAFDVSASLSSNRLAFLQWHYVGSGHINVTHFPAVAGEITVLDWGTKHSVGKIDLEGPTQNPSVGLQQSALALSPDGKYLAVLLHHTLTYYRLQ